MAGRGLIPNSEVMTFRHQTLAWLPTNKIRTTRRNMSSGPETAGQFGRLCALANSFNLLTFSSAVHFQPNKTQTTAMRLEGASQSVRQFDLLLICQPIEFGLHFTTNSRPLRLNFNLAPSLWWPFRVEPAHRSGDISIDFMAVTRKYNEDVWMRRNRPVKQLSYRKRARACPHVPPAR